MSFDKIFDLAAGVIFYFQNIQVIPSAKKLQDLGRD